MKSCVAILAVTPFLLAGAVSAQRASQPTPTSTAPTPPQGGLPDTPQVFGTEAQRYRVVPINGLSSPWALAFLPNGDILVTERPGRLRIIRKGVLDPKPIAGVPEVNTRATLAGLMDVAVHPGMPRTTSFISPIRSRGREILWMITNGRAASTRKRSSATRLCAR